VVSVGNLDNDNLVTDIGNINYTLGEKQLKNFTQITEPFCDNIIIVKITDFSECEGNLENVTIR
jgi:hypothetical protein